MYTTQQRQAHIQRTTNPTPHRILRAALLVLFLLVTRASGQDVQPLPLGLRSDNLGVTFIAYLEQLENGTAAERYRQALAMGVGWNRYPIYWDQVERTPGVYDWNAYDQLVALDQRAGIQTNAILIGIPGHHQAGNIMAGLNEPIFADGSDTLGTGKAINPGNPWASYVREVVNRYRPGGVLARERGWRSGEGITVWEAWNEPDLDLFWKGSQMEYARLLKVTYLAVKSVDPDAQVMFGGLAYGNPDTDDWLRAVLNLYSGDPARGQYNWYMDIVGLHSYNDSRRTGLVVARVRDTLRQFGLSTPIWLNETGVPVWDDYPGPTWAADDPAERWLSATQEQQAAFVVQSAAYAFAAGAEKVFFHQFYDDCGDNGGAYAENDTGGIVFGFYRNARSASCYSGHPTPATARPAAEAFRALADVLGNGALNGGQVIRRSDGSVFVRFARPNNERVTIMWSERTTDSTITWNAESPSARLISDRFQSFTLAPQGGVYTVTLPPARMNDDPNRLPNQLILIGGRTFLMRERLTQTAPTGEVLAAVGDPALPSVVTPRAPLPAQIGSVLDNTASGTISMANTAPTDDVSPPITGMDTLPAVSPETFTVRWNGADAGGIETYVVWVRVNDGEWGPWLETSRTEAEYSGVVGNTYAFAVWAVDYAGNWSLNTDLRAQAVTRVEG